MRSRAIEQWPEIHLHGVDMRELFSHDQFKLIDKHSFNCYKTHEYGIICIVETAADSFAWSKHERYTITYSIYLKKS